MSLEPVREGKIASHEDAAHEKRNWVRLTFDCNDHCVFCLDAHTHTGEMRDREEVKAQILDGRRKGATPGSSSRAASPRSTRISWISCASVGSPATGRSRR